MPCPPPPPDCSSFLAPSNDRLVSTLAQYVIVNHTVERAGPFQSMSSAVFTLTTPIIATQRLETSLKARARPPTRLS